MKPVRFGLVGAGRIANAYSEAFLSCQEAELVAVADVRLDAARALGARHGAAVFSSAGLLAGAKNLDAVLICVEPAAHDGVALEFLETGVHVLCEKPFAVSTARAGAVLERARRAGLIATMASKFRYVHDVQMARTMIASGQLGQVAKIENVFAWRVDMSGRWNSNSELSGGGVLIDNGSHSADIMRCLAGPVTAVLASSSPLTQGQAVEDTACMRMRTDSGVQGEVVLSWTQPAEHDWYLQVSGTDGILQLGWRASRWRRTSQHEWLPIGEGYDKYQALRDNLQNMARALWGEETTLVSGDDAFASVAVIEAAYESIRCRQWRDVGTGSEWRDPWI